MNHYYADILERIPEPPQWWDERAIPRFCAFHPSETADIYADEAALLLIRCQSCGREFRVAMSRSTYDRHVIRQSYLANDIKANRITYGDPPNARCCPLGPAMSAVEIRVIEYWQKNRLFEWNRVDEYEIDLSDQP